MLIRDSTRYMFYGYIHGHYRIAPVWYIQPGKYTRTSATVPGHFIGYFTFSSFAFPREEKRIRPWSPWQLHGNTTLSECQEASGKGTSFVT